MSSQGCRFCGNHLEVTFCDLGMSPLSNAFLASDQLNRMEPFYPLHAYVCEFCRLVQLQAFETPDNIFSDYVYFSSYSETWLEHVRVYAQRMIGALGLGPNSQVVEVASNDGYLLKNFKAAGIPVLGIEPAENVANVAESAGIPSLVRFFGKETASDLAADGIRADLLVGNNVLAHVPDLNDFVAGMKILLAPGGTITMEFPHLLRLIEGNQFDTIYHEHFSYFSLITVEKVFAHHGIELHDVEELPTHGGSLRIFGRHAGRNGPTSPSISGIKKRELDAGLDQTDTYTSFGRRVAETKRRLLDLLLDAKDSGKTIVAYGAAAKGNTLLNYCGVRTDIVDYVADRSPHKQGLFLPGTHIPVYAPERIAETRPDLLLVLPWNIRNEVMGQMAHVRKWGGQFIVPIPNPEIVA
jgi:2-polyprenyl-3-methyl-5-hydroxy-6-metoxy-1,4-benzoquinol methylase